MEGRKVVCAGVVVNNPTHSAGEKSEGGAGVEGTPGLAQNIKQPKKKKRNTSNKRLPTDVK